MAKAACNDMDEYMGFQCFNEGERNSIKEAVAKGDMNTYVELLQKQLNMWKTIPLNIAVIGSSGVGKSSFINAIRNVTADDSGAAEVGCTETTSKIISYPYPNNEMLKLWDLPGVGTPNFPKETYLETIQVERYDFFLLLAARFTESDKWLGTEIADRHHKKFFYVRTKIHDELKNQRKAHPRKFHAEAALKKIRDKTLENLKDIGSDCTKVFLIDSYKPQLYDFQELNASMINRYPEMKRQALVLSSNTFSEKMIKMKADMLRKWIGLHGALSAGVALVPIPGVSLAIDITTTLAMAKRYHKQFGLDEESLKRHAQLTSIDLPQLQRVVKNSLGDEFLTIPSLKNLMTAAAIAGPAAEEFMRFVPVVGSCVAGALSFAETYFIHKIIIDKLETTTLKVFSFTAECANKTPQLPN